MLLISYHILYTFPLPILFIFFMFMPANTTEVNTIENCMYPKVLSLYETVILYDPNEAAIMIQTGSMSLT